MRMIRPASWFWPPLAVMPSLRSAPGTLPPSIESGSSTAVTTVERALGHGGEAEAGRAHQRLLGAGHDDVDAPVVLAQLGGAEAGDRVDREDHAVPGGDLGDRLDVMDDAGRGLAQR